MNYDSYLLWLGYFSSVTAELLVVGSGGGGEAKREAKREAQMNISLLEKEKHERKKHALLLILDSVPHVHFLFLYFQNAPKGQRGKMF